MDSVECPSQSIVTVQASISGTCCRNVALAAVMLTGTGNETFDRAKRFRAASIDGQAAMRPYACGTEMTEKKRNYSPCLRTHDGSAHRRYNRRSTMTGQLRPTS
jgi:hypothetical protein